jgi:SAM-dependent methyltransferase
VAHFLEAATSGAMRHRLAELFNSDPRYRVLHYLLGPERMLEWAHSVGVASDDVLASCVSPLPPEDLRALVADPQLEIFLFTGFLNLELFTRLYRAHAAQPPARPRILDFGCGCGRMTRLLDMLPGWQAFGSDVNPDHVEWCQESLKNVDTRLNGTAPPLPFDDATFDLICALSVFTHLPEAGATAWLADLGRVVKPDGLLILTTHGTAALDTILTSTPHLELMGRPRDEFELMRQTFGETAYVFQPYAADVTGRAKAGSEYGNTFIHPNRAITMLRDTGFDVREHLPAGMQAWQDVFVCAPASV